MRAFERHRVPWQKIKNKRYGRSTPRNKAYNTIFIVIFSSIGIGKPVVGLIAWPISKVAVLLIDSKKENCFLKFGAVTKGAWSPIEKELDESSTNPEISAEEEFGDKREQNDHKALTCNSEFLRLGYDAVKDVTGMPSIILFTIPDNYKIL